MICSMRGYDLCTVRSGKWKLHGAASGPREQTVMQKGDFSRDPARARRRPHPGGPASSIPPLRPFPGVATGYGGKGWALFDLAKDPSEQTNLASDNPKIGQRTACRVRAVQAQMPPSPASKKKKDKDKGACVQETSRQARRQARRKAQGRGCQRAAHRKERTCRAVMG